MRNLACVLLILMVTYPQKGTTCLMRDVGDGRCGGERGPTSRMRGHSFFNVSAVTKPKAIRPLPHPGAVGGKFAEICLSRAR
jgi:hypothetical protein